MHKAVTLMLSLSLLAGCSSQPFNEQSSVTVEERNPGAVSISEVKKVDVTDRNDVTDPRLKDPNNPLSKRIIYFDLDSYIVKSEYQPLLGQHAKFLITNAKYKMLIQGNADERGSREYNLALGHKRADAVKRALMMLGAKDDQLESVSLGEERPACSEPSEGCWAKNRRGEMLYSGEF